MNFRILNRMFDFVSMILPKKTIWNQYGIRKFIQVLFSNLPETMKVNGRNVELHFTSFGSLPNYKIGFILDHLDRHHFIVSIIPLQKYESELFEHLPITIIEGDYTPEQVAEQIKQHLDKKV